MPWRNYSEPWRNAQRDRAVATSSVQPDLSQGGLELPQDQKVHVAVQTRGSGHTQVLLPQSLQGLGVFFSF